MPSRGRGEFSQASMKPAKSFGEPAVHLGNLRREIACWSRLLRVSPSGGDRSRILLQGRCPYGLLRLPRRVLQGENRRGTLKTAEIW